MFSVESEAKAKTRVRFEEIFRNHPGLRDKKKLKKRTLSPQENIVVSWSARNIERTKHCVWNSIP